MSESIKQRVGGMADRSDAAELRKLFDAAQADLASLRTQIIAINDDVGAIRTSLVAITAKLDLDAGVTDTDYATNDPAAITAADPGALTLTS